MNTTQMEINVSGRRIEVGIMPNGETKILVESAVAPLIVPEKKIMLPRSEFERHIDPLLFQLDADWLKYEPRTDRQKQTKELFLDARVKGRLHTFTCMAIDPSFDPVTGEVVYQPGLPPAVGKSYNWWEGTFNDYAPERNSRVLTRTEGVCKNLELIRRLVTWKKVSVEKAWDAVCDSSGSLGHQYNSDNPKRDFEPTGCREVCGFYDLANVTKILAKDPWEEASGYWSAAGNCNSVSFYYPLAYFCRGRDVINAYKNTIAMLAMDQQLLELYFQKRDRTCFTGSIFL